MKTWTIGKLANNINRDFINIKNAHLENGVLYTKERFNIENKQAIKIADDALVSMVYWYENYRVLR